MKFRKFYFILSMLLCISIIGNAQTNFKDAIEKVSDVQFSRMMKDYRVRLCKIIEIPYSYADKGYKGYVADSSTYDGSGNLLSHTSFYSDGKINKSQIYTYDAAGNTTSMIRYQSGFHTNPSTRRNEKGEMMEVFGINQEESTYKETYTYDEKGNMLSSTYHDPGGSTSTTYFKYDEKLNYNVFNDDHSPRLKYQCVYEKGKLIKKIMLSLQDTVIGKSEWKYNDSGMLAEYKTDGKNDYSMPFSAALKYDAKGNMVELTYIDEFNKQYSKWIYSYDALKRISELVIYDAKNAFTTKETYVYDDKGLLKAKMTYNNPDTPMTIENYEYEFFY